MKKFLAICSIFLTVCATFTGCGSENKSDVSDREKSAVTDEKRDTNNDMKSAGDRVEDAVRGAGRAGDDIIEGATDAIGDVIDGLDGDNHKDKTTDTKQKR